MTTQDIKAGWTSGAATQDTIYALSTAPGRAGVAVIRISGPKSADALFRLTGCAAPPPRRASLRRIHHPRNGELIDNALVFLFEEGASFTGEEIAELHVHGGVAVVSATLDALGSLHGLRPAAPGEFTRRAFDNGELDLAQVEGLADLISAETELQRRQALQLIGGELSKKAEHWRAELIYALAMVEATIDWADEEVPVNVSPEVSARLRSVSAQLEKEIAGATAARALRDGFEIAIIGAPNVGKSSLINAIGRCETSIISPLPGTTRDVIEMRCDVMGAPVTFLDTAGLREAEDIVERIGVDRAKKRAAGADLRVVVSCPDIYDGCEAHGSTGDVLFWNKADLGGSAPSMDWIAGSAKLAHGVDALVERIAEILRTKTAASSLAANDRVVSRLRQGREFALAAADALELGGESELVSEEIRGAIRSLEEIVGRIETDDMLDVVFSQFCIGK